MSATVYTYTTTATSYSEDPSVTYTNVRPKQAVEVHVALVGSGGTVTLDDVQRSSSSYSFEIPIDYPTSDPANTKTFLTEIPSETLFTGDNTYGFAGIIYGTDGGGQGDTVMIAGAINSTVTYGHISDTVYELYFDDTTSRLKGENNIYYLYYPLPKLVYVKETAGGALEKIKGSTNGSTVSDTITYNGSALTFNGASVEQEQLLSVSKELFTITQTVAAGNFNMPPLLDDGTDKLYLTYSKIGAAGTADAASTSALAAVSETKLLYLKVVDNQVKWSIDSTNWNSFTGTSPTVYAIYKEKGYSLEVTKALAEDTGNTFTKNFTVTISSMSIIASSYEVTGTGYNTISATPANGATPGSITLTMRDGSDIRISGLAKGDYTVTETEDIGYTLSAQAGDAEGTLSDWTVTGATLNAITLNTDKKVALTNTRNYVEITVKKSLVDTTDTNRFGFYAALTDNGSAVNAKTFGTGAAATTTDSSGRVSAFYLVHNGTKTLTVPVGAVLEIVESAAKDSSEALVEIGNYTATIVASETANAALSYNSGIVDEDSKTYTLDTVPNKALTVTFTNSSGVDIKFKKIDGFGTAQQGAVFSLYTNPGCTTALEVSGTALTGTSDSSGVVIFNNKIPNGIYYMRETTVPAGGYVNSSSRDGSGNPIPNTYIVLVGDKAMGKTELDASAATYLEGITTTVISGQTALYKAEYRDEDSDYDKYAIFLIDSDSTSDTYNKAVATPDIAAYGIMNVSTVTQKVILDKITNTKDTLPGAVFELLAYDRSVMEASLTSGTADEESMRYGGAFYVGRLPQGIYYVHEKTVPSGYDGTKTWWTLTVSRTGAVTLTGPAASAPE